MSLDGKVLSRAINRLELRRAEDASLAAKRLEEVYSLSPRIREIDATLKGLMVDVIGISIKNGGNPEKALDKIRGSSLELQRQRELELAALGLPSDYTDEHYRCERCKDTGFIGIKRCKCLMELYKEEQAKELSSLLKLGDETFDTFDLDYYDNIPDGSTGISPRSSMEFVYETCVEYARKFGHGSFNLLFTGGPGLGKTFLSACIARVVSESGFSVVYDTAFDIFTKMEDEKFSKAGDVMDSVKTDTRRYMTCDLLILDDLGTELTTAFVKSALYNLINSRLNSKRQTIISTNLSVDELCARYSPQIASRIEGEYQILPFFGRDIRKLKKEKQ